GTTRAERRRGPIGAFDGRTSALRAAPLGTPPAEAPPRQGAGEAQKGALRPSRHDNKQRTCLLSTARAESNRGDHARSFRIGNAGRERTCSYFATCGAVRYGPGRVARAHARSG